MEILILPPGGPLILLLIGVVLVVSKGPGGAVLLLLGAGALYLSSVPAVAYRLIQALESRSPPRVQAQDGQAIVILGAGRNVDALEYGGDTVNSMALQRLRYGARLYKETGLPILLSGGRVYGEPRSEAELGKAILEAEFCTPVRWTEERSRNTLENARNSVAMLRDQGITRILLVTHAYHMPRALWSFRAQGITALPAATGYSTRGPLSQGLYAWLPQATALLVTRIALHEWLGSLWYRLSPSAS